MQVSSRSFEMKLIGPARCAAQLSIFLASIIFPPLSRSQAPIFELSPIESWINFDVEQNPLITFKSTKFVRTGPHTFEVDGDFTIRGVSNPEKLTLTVSGKGTGSGEIKGSMVFNRKDYGMDKGIPFIKIADHIDVNFHLKGKRVSGPPMDPS